MAIIEHVFPAVNLGEQAHEESGQCWCKPTVMTAFEGTDHHHEVWHHNRPPDIMDVGARKRVAKKATPKKLATTKPAARGSARRQPAKKVTAKKVATKK